ncbi:MAG: cupredoxin domain-containing protein [Acidimicrobiia bacterium]|nr:cupredoxin domain-containing protein [Acidimicrobiia bacterium]
MSPTGRRRAAITAAALGVVVIAPSACGVEVDSGWPATTEVPVPAEVTGEPDHLLEIPPGASELPTLTVPVGTSVTWLNDPDSEEDHWFVSDGPGDIESATLQPGNSYSHRFDEPGTFEYFCRIHPELRGTVVVE